MARADSLLLLDEEKDIQALCGKLHKYVKNFPWDGELLSYYGEALCKAGKNEQALFYMKKARSTLRNGIRLAQIEEQIGSLERTG